MRQRENSAKPRYNKQILQPDEVRYMLNDDTPDFNLYAWQLMLLYGFRPSEVYGLQWSSTTELL